MSVLKSQRTESKVEFWNTAAKLRVELSKFVMNEKHVPKRWKHVITYPVIDMATQMLNYIVAANTIHVTRNDEAVTRDKYQTEALIKLEQLYDLLQFGMEALNHYPDALQPIADLMAKEEQLLKAWQKSDRARYKEFF